MAHAASIRKVAVLGAGTIGASWTAWFLSRGLHVTVSDPNPGAEAYVARFVADAWPALARLGMTTDADPAAWRFVADPAACVADADFVQENAPERLPVKRALFAAIEPALRAEAIVASSTSGLLASDLQHGLATPGRFVIGHPFNPPHLIPLVEVVGGRATDEAAIVACMAFYASIGKRPIRVRREVMGHLVNRLQAALMREAVSAVASGLASVADVDTAIAYGPGLRWAIMGPHLTAHLGGGEGGITHYLSQFGPSFEAWWADLGTPTMDQATCRALIDGVAEEAAGRSIAQLSAERDARLVALLELLAPAGR